MNERPGEEERPPRRADLRRAEDLFGFGIDEGQEPEAPEAEAAAARGERRAPGAPARRRGGGVLRGETMRRVLVVIPWIAFTIAIIVAGGLPFALAMVALGMVGLRELFVMTHALRPIQIPAYLAVAGLVLAAHLGSAFHILLVLVAAFPLLFAFGADRRHRDGATVSLGVTLLGIAWIGLPLAHAVLLRDLPDHGAALLVDVLVGTFVADTAAYATGRMFGTRRITPAISPNKTLEGLLGGFVIGTMGFWFAGLYQDWLSGVDALLMGAAVAAVAPIGDLFESLIKRDLGRKDTGTLFGPHGGLLDRLDSVFFTVVVGYYLAVQLVY